MNCLYGAYLRVQNELPVLALNQLLDVHGRELLHEYRVHREGRGRGRGVRRVHHARRGPGRRPVRGEGGVVLAQVVAVVAVGGAPGGGGRGGGGGVAVVRAGDGAPLEHHLVLGERPRLVTEDVLDLEEICSKVMK